MLSNNGLKGESRVESHGCNSRHPVGDKFYFDGAGNLLSELSPKKS